MANNTLALTSAFVSINAISSRLMGCLAHFKPKLRKLKKPTLKKFLIFFEKNVFLIFQEMEHSSPKLLKLLHFV